MKKTLSKTILNKIALFLIGISSLSLTSCLDKDEDPVAPQPISFVSFYHGAPSAPDMNILIDGGQINNVPFKYSDYTNYLGFRPRSVKVKFGPTNAVNPSRDTTLTLVEDKIYSIFVVDEAAQIDLLVLTDDSLETPATGKAGVRFVHLSPDAPAVDVATTGTSAANLFSNVGFKGSTDFIELAAGKHTLQVKNAGGSDVLLPVPNVELTAGRIYTFVFRGFVTPPAGNTKTLDFQVLPAGKD
jgi:hypothetical protein